MRKWILPIAVVASLSACGSMDQSDEITTGGGATNEVLEPVERTPAEWPTDQRPYQEGDVSGSSGMEGQSSGSSEPAPEVIIVEPVESAPSSGGSSSMESESSGSSVDQPHDVKPTPSDGNYGSWPTDQRPYQDSKQ